MSRQTEQLLLFPDDSPKQDSVDDGVTPQYIGETKERLRLLDDLTRHKGFQLLMEAINGEARSCMIALDRCDNPTAITKTAAQLYSLTHCAGWVANEMVKLRAFLESLPKH